MKDLFILVYDERLNIIMLGFALAEVHAVTYLSLTFYLPVPEILGPRQW